VFRGANPIAGSTSAELWFKQAISVPGTSSPGVRWVAATAEYGPWATPPSGMTLLGTTALVAAFEGPASSTASTLLPPQEEGNCGTYDVVTLTPE